MKTALLVISFGTTHLDTLAKTIAATENNLAAAFPEATLFRAFTSGIVRKRLKANYGIHVDSVEEAMTRICNLGYDRVVAQPTLLIPGEEYDKLSAAIAATAGNLQVCLGKPLLCGEADMDELIAAVRQAYPTEPDTLLLLMGHGTDHAANDLYIRMAEKMEPTAMRLCTVEGTPSFESVLEELSNQPQKKILLAPLLFVAGDHAKNDMAGDEPDSLRAMLEARGYCVTCAIQGLGELPEVRRMYIDRAKEVY